MRGRLADAGCGYGQEGHGRPAAADGQAARLDPKPAASAEGCSSVQPGALWTSWLAMTPPPRRSPVQTPIVNVVVRSSVRSLALAAIAVIPDDERDVCGVR